MNSWVTTKEFLIEKWPVHEQPGEINPEKATKHRVVKLCALLDRMKSIKRIQSTIISKITILDAPTILLIMRTEEAIHSLIESFLLRKIQSGQESLLLSSPPTSFYVSSSLANGGELLFLFYFSILCNPPKKQQSTERFILCLYQSVYSTSSTVPLYS